VDVHPGSPRRWWLGIAIIVAAAAGQQAAILITGGSSNPLAQMPILDARAYWERAAEIAAGQWRDVTPFMGAPLYPYLLGALRAVGGNLPAAYMLQVVMHLATIVLVGWAARQRFGDTAGWIAAALYVLLLEPAFYTGRILTCSLQALLVTASLVLLQRAQRSGRTTAWAAAGSALGLGALASPPMLAAIPCAVLLAGWRRPLFRRGLARAAACGVAAAVCVAPATLHNYLVSREWIVVSAQAGITFAQGNSSGAIGIYNPISGVSRDRRQQNLDVLRVAQREKGPSAGWNDASRVFFARGIEYLQADLRRAAELLLRKLTWLVASDVYGDIYLPAVERAEGLARALWLAPLSLAWLAGLSACGVVLLLRRPIRFAPELILAAVPILTVLAFFYSPRYRFPIAPLAVIAAAGFIISALQLRVKWIGIVAVAGAAAAGPLISCAITRQAGPLHDTIESWRAPLHQKLARIALDEKRYAEVVSEGQRAIELEPRDALSHQILASGLDGLGQAEEAMPHYRRAIELDPNLVEPRFRLGEWLMRRGRLAEGLEAFEGAVSVAPLAPEVYTRRAQARAASGQMELADEDVRRAIELAREQGQDALADGYRVWWEQLKTSAARPK
jgi:4-amino-4-deoxy-L-arabinose transferase-like glycosyltransferase